MAEEIDSPVAVTSAESCMTGTTSSIEAGLDTSFLQGPGESPDMSGDGRGVTSDIALSIGDETTEFGAEPRLVVLPKLPKLPAKTFFTLGVRGMGIELGAGCSSIGFGTGVMALAAVTVYPGTSVWIRRLGLRGLAGDLGDVRSLRGTRRLGGGRRDVEAIGFKLDAVGVASGEECAS
jgi:hypothetical protein